MASSSSSSPVIISETKHDVFVSFKGEDTRYNFISHLDAAFRRKQITAFIDYQLIKGDEISPSLTTAIDGSDISVVVFSEQYASSRWCLDELVQILECKNKYGQIVIPIFYHVDPSHVRKQEGNFGKSFSRLQERFQDKLDKLEIWATALSETANLSGFHLQANRREYEFIEEIVNNVLKRLSKKGGSHDIDHLIGVDSVIMELESLLSTALTSVYTLGIWGIGGIGKTTIARAILGKISSRFEGSCFFENVREKEEKVGLDWVKQQLFYTLLEDNPNNAFAFERLKRKRVVVVFDDVTRIDQIEFLIGSLNSFGDGSRIIITTRDRKVLDKVNGIYKMKGLLDHDALELFCQNSFGQICPDVGFEELSKEIITYAGGVPLALKVLGSFLFGRKKGEWKSAIKKLKKEPHERIQTALKISYDGLDDDEQKIFLDIVFFLKGKNKDYIIEFLDACGFSTKIGVKVLEERCLINISNNKITMHDLMEEMGKEIVRQESDYPEERSRLCDDNDIYDVLTCYTGTKAIQGISFNMPQAKETCFKLSTFKKMPNLRFLEFCGRNNCKLSNCPTPVFFKLRHLSWNGYPLKSLPFHLHPEYLFSLELHNSKIKKLWDGDQDLGNLKHLDLSFSKLLEKLSDLKKAPNLKNLILKGCSSLVEIDPSIQFTKLVFMDLRDCESLKSLPPRIHSGSLEDLFLSGCKNLMRFPDVSFCNIKRLDLDRIAIEELPSSIECLSRLGTLYISSCSRLKHLPRSMCKLKVLDELSISECPNLQRLPDSLGNLKCLWKLNVTRTPVKEVPSSIGSSHTLTFLTLSDCRITKLPKLPYNLKAITVDNCLSLKALPSNLSRLLEHCAAQRGSLYIDLKNCFELDPNKLSKIVKRVLQNVQLIETKCWEETEIEGSENFHMLRCGRHAGIIFYPGSEIPGWFEFQGMGSSGILKLGQGWLQNKLVGIVICAIVTFADEEIYMSYELLCTWKVNTKEDQWHRNTSRSWFDAEVDYVDLDHLFLRYQITDDIFPEGFDECSYNEQVFIQFSAFHLFDEIDCSKVVKKWGIHFLYREDSVEFMKGRSSDVEESIDEEGANEEESNDEDGSSNEEESNGEDGSSNEEESNGEEDSIDEEGDANEEESNGEEESIDEEEGANEEESNGEDDSTNEEESTDEEEEPHPERVKYSTSSFFKKIKICRGEL